MRTLGEQTQAALKAENERLKAEIAQLKVTSQQKLMARDALIRDIYNSSSWRFARPIRALKKAFNLFRKNEAHSKPNSAVIKNKSRNDKTWQKVSEAEALALLAESQLFDPDWYRKQYPDVVKTGLDPALHYIRRGGAAKRKPSIYFDPIYYLDQNPSVARSGIPPLIHYLKYGQSEGKKPLALLEIPQPEGPRPLNMPDAPIVASPNNKSEDAVVWAKHVDLATAEDRNVLCYGDVILARLPSVEATAHIIVPVAAFCRLMGVDVSNHVCFNGLANDPGILAEPNLERALATQQFHCLGVSFRTGPACIGDAWFANETVLRVRFGQDRAEDSNSEQYVVRAFQADAAAPEEIALIGEALLPATGPAFVDLTLSSPLLPVLLVLSTPDGVAIDGGILPFPSLCRGGMHHAELSYFGEHGNPIEDLKLFSDVLVQEYIRPDAGSPRLIQRIAVGLETATGAERIFSSSALEWLARIFSLHVVPSIEDSEAAHTGVSYLRDFLHNREGIRSPLLERIEQDAEGGCTLLLPPESLPTISALVSRGARAQQGTDKIAGPFLVADSVTCRPRWSVALPPITESLLALQPSGTVPRYPVLILSDRDMVSEWHSVGQSVADLPLAIHYSGETSQDEATMLMPLAPDASKPALRRVLTQNERAQASVTAIITCTTVLGTNRLLQSLAQQTFSDKIDVVAIIRPDSEVGPEAFRSDLEHFFNGRHDVILASDKAHAFLHQAVDGLRGRFTLLAEDTIVLHDPRTIETLATMAHGENVASASCVILHEAMVHKGSIVRFQSGGFFPSHVSLQSAPRLIMNQPNWLEMFADATFPVAGNSFDLSLVNTDALRQYLASEPRALSGSNEGLKFGLKTLSSGYVHLCTSAVRATSFASSTGQQHLDPVGRNFIRPSHWEQLLASVTLLRELR